MKKVSFIVMIFVVTAVLMTGCLQLRKDPITTEKFISIAENEGMTIKDVLEEVSENKQILEATVAQHKDGWEIEFYKLADLESAMKLFESNKEIMEGEVDENVSTSIEAGNYARNSWTTEDSYTYLSYIEDSFICVKVDKKYKKDVKAFCDKIGY